MRLDVGCGWKPSGDVNVDLYPSEIKHRSRVAEGVDSHALAVKGIPNFVLASSLALPFRDGVFDEVVSSHVIEHVPDPAVMIREMLRVSCNQVVIRCPHCLGDTKKNKLHLWHFNRKSFERFLNPLGLHYELSNSRWRVFPSLLLPLARLPAEITVKVWKN